MQINISNKKDENVFSRCDMVFTFLIKNIVSWFLINSFISFKREDTLNEYKSYYHRQSKRWCWKSNNLYQSGDWPSKVREESYVGRYGLTRLPLQNTEMPLLMYRKKSNIR